MAHTSVSELDLLARLLLRMPDLSSVYTLFANTEKI